VPQLLEREARMNIPPISSPINALAETPIISPVGASAATLPLVDPTNAGSASVFVEISGLGQLASATAGFQTAVAALLPGGSGIGQNFGGDLSGVAAQAQFLVDAFNGLQSTLASLTGAGGPLAGDALAAQIASQLNAQATATFSNGSSNLTTLAQIGIAFQPAASGGGSLNIDMAALEAAFQADPAATMALLSQAASAFNGLAGGFIAQTGSQLSAMSMQIAAEAVQQSLLVNALRDMTGLIGASASSGSGSGDTMGLATLLALESYSSLGNHFTPLVALSEFNLVSSLLG
jgi:hypothetical protein